MRKSKISAPVGFNPKPVHNAPVHNAPVHNAPIVTMQETQTVTVSASLGFSLEMVPTGKFVTVEFINKYGVIRRYNGRTGVKKYLKHTGYKSEETRKKYFVLWIRRDGKQFDGVALIDKTKIIRLSAGGVVLWANKDSRYTKTV